MWYEEQAAGLRGCKKCQCFGGEIKDPDSKEIEVVCSGRLLPLRQDLICPRFRRKTTEWQRREFDKATLLESPTSGLRRREW